jgi:hypothetical protein
MKKGRSWEGGSTRSAPKPDAAIAQTNPAAHAIRNMVHLSFAFPEADLRW